MTRLLLGNIGLENPHGSEIWTWTIAEHLKTRGFEITILTNDIGQFASDYLDDFEVVTTVKSRIFDYGIINHARSLKDINNIKVNKVIFVSHGCISDIERPIENFNLPHEYVSVSEEVRAHWLDKIGIESSVIVNPIRDEWFKIESETIDLNSIVFANHRHQIPEEMVNILKAAGIHFRRLRRGWSQSDVMAFMEVSQIIIGTGRYIYEGMAAGRRVIVANATHSLGYVTKSNYDNLVSFNMTCRNPESFKPDWNKLIQDYSLHNPADMREIALREHHVSVIAEKFLEKLHV